MTTKINFIFLQIEYLKTKNFIRNKKVLTNFLCTTIKGLNNLLFIYE